MTEPHIAIRDRLARVRDRIADACARCGRDPAEVTIVCVTKRHPPAIIEAAARAGIEDIGESYAQELVAKQDQVAPAIARALRWHFIGKLQRNKIKYLCGRVALIHAVDSLALAQAIDQRIERRAREAPGEPAQPQRVLVAVNIAGEAQKSGVAPDAAGELVAGIGALRHVECVGLMTMPPLAHDPDDSRPHFRALAALRDRLRTPDTPLPELSIGTTSDFAAAVAEGATLVRIGTAIVGPRPA